MQEISEQFAHVLLFACPDCSRPLASACFSSKRNLEEADAHFFNPHCHCGWTGTVAGIQAVKHWVHAWPAVTPVLGVTGSDEGSCESAPKSPAAV